MTEANEQTTPATESDVLKIDWNMLTNCEIILDNFLKEQGDEFGFYLFPEISQLWNSNIRIQKYM